MGNMYRSYLDTGKFGSGNCKIKVEKDMILGRWQICLGDMRKAETLEEVLLLQGETRCVMWKIDTKRDVMFIVCLFLFYAITTAVPLYHGVANVLGNLLCG